MKIITACKAYIVRGVAWNEFETAIVVEWNRGVLFNEADAEQVAATLNAQAETIFKRTLKGKRDKELCEFDPIFGCSYRGEVGRFHYRVDDWPVPVGVNAENYTLASVLKMAA